MVPNWQRELQNDEIFLNINHEDNSPGAHGDIFTHLVKCLMLLQENNEQIDSLHFWLERQKK